MLVEVTKGARASIIGPDSETGKSAMIAGDVVFVANSAADVRGLLEDVARWHDAAAPHGSEVIAESTVTEDAGHPSPLGPGFVRGEILQELVEALEDSRIITEILASTGVATIPTIRRIRAAVEAAKCELTIPDEG